MKFHHYSSCMAAVAISVGLSSCVDDGYDLANIDTTTRIDVKDLTVPMNLDAVTLSDIIDEDEDSKIKSVTIGGRDFYALVESGTFSSDPIEVKKVKADAPVLNPTQKTLDQVKAEGRRRGNGSVDEDYVCTYKIVEMGNDIEYKATDIDEAIESVTSVRIDPLDFKVHLDALNAAGKVDEMVFTDLVLKMPLGMTATCSVGSYDPVSGIWSIPYHKIGNDHSTDATLTATAIDFAANGCSLQNHVIDFKSKFIVESGLLTITPLKVNGVPTPLPDQLEFRASYSVDDVVANSFTGRIHYNIEGMDIAPVNLSDIPDFLKGDETEIYLANPQIYIQTNNPVADNMLTYEVGLSLDARRAGENDYVLPDSPRMSIGYGSANGLYNNVLATSSNDLTVPEAFANPTPTFVEYASLGTLLAAPAGSQTKGLPDQIGISVVNPCIPSSEVVDFELGRKINGIQGSYELMAPLALKKGSVIVYSSSDSGWSSEDLDAVTITALTLTCQATNSTPLEATLTLTPIDINGNPIKDPKTGKEVVITSNKLAANTTTPTELVFNLSEGSVNGLDGVIYKAYVVSDNAATLAPDQVINLTKIRAKVSGYYQKEL